MSDVSHDFVTDRLAVGNVASRAVPSFVAVVSLLHTEPGAAPCGDEGTAQISLDSDDK